MRTLRTALAMAAALGVCLGCAVSTEAVAQAAKPVAADDNPVDPESVQALRRMSAYLMTLKSFEMKANTTVEVVTLDGQRIQLDGVTTYKVRGRDAFQVDNLTDLKHRRFYYDGKQFTVFAPELGYYATAPAPPTTREVIATIYQKFGIVLPLEDLFRWSDPQNTKADKLTSAFLVGPGTVDGVLTDHYAFRGDDTDWEVWIERGDRPIPRKLVIVDRTDPAAPGYTARLSWTLNPSLAASTFTFKPPPDSKAIQLATLQQ